MVRDIVLGGDEVGMGPAVAGENQASPASSSVPAAVGDDPHTQPVPRHPAFDGIVGQAKLIERLQQLAGGCSGSGRPLPPILLVGPSGTGKTQVAQAVAELMGVDRGYLNCNSTVTLTALIDILERMRPHDVMIFDEVDKLRKEVQVALLSVLEGRQVRRPARNGRHPEAERPVSLPHVSYISTSTRPGKMMGDLLSRFTDFHLEEYRPNELAEISRRIAVAEGKMLQDDAAVLLSGSCFGIPRDVMKRTQELCLTSPSLEIDEAMVRRFLFDRGIHSGGWSATHYKLLSLVGINGAPKSRIYNMAGIDANLVESYEAQLIKAGLVEVQMAHGRSLTTDGLLVLRQLRRIFS